MVVYCTEKKGCETYKTPSMVVSEKEKSEGVAPNIQTQLVKTRKSDKREVTSPEAAYEVLKDIVDKDRENVNILHLDSRNKLVGVERISIGDLNSAIMSPREVFKGAILNNSKAIIIGHNHPSGNTKESPEDRQVYRQLKEGGDLLMIPVLDFMVVSNEGFNSLRDKV